VRDETEDRRLVRAYLRARSEGSFRILYEAHAPAMYALASHLLLSPRDAEDVLQDAWMRAVRRLDAFRWDSTLRTWLCGFVVNCCRERSRVRDWEPLPEIASHPADRAAALDLRSAMAELPAGYRAVLVLHDVYGHTHAEIAALLDIDEGTSKSQLSRARRWMRGRLGTGSIATGHAP
jgi:RNA polymerase sigma-70 factor (ECF subfamily)